MQPGHGLLNLEVCKSLLYDVAISFVVYKIHNAEREREREREGGERERD